MGGAIYDAPVYLVRDFISNNDLPTVSAQPQNPDNRKKFRPEYEAVEIKSVMSVPRLRRLMGTPDLTKAWEGATQNHFLQPSVKIGRGVALFADFPDVPFSLSGRTHANFLKQRYGWTGGLDSPMSRFVQAQSRGTHSFDLMTLEEYVALSQPLTIAGRDDVGRDSKRTIRDSTRFVRMPKKSTEYATNRGHRAFIADAITEHAKIWRARVGPGKKFLSSVDFVVIFTPPIAKPPNGYPFLVSSTLVDEPKFPFEKETGLHRAITVGKDFYDEDGFWTLAHEYGHILGLPDLYPSGGSWSNSLAGPWGLMSDSHRANSFLCWHRFKLGWLDYTRATGVEVEGTRKHKLYPPDSTAGVVMIAVTLGGEGESEVERVNQATKFLIIERAQPIRPRGDGKNPYGDGVLMYTVDGSTTGQSPVVLVFGRPKKADKNKIKYGNFHQSLVGYSSNLTLPFDLIADSKLDSKSRRKNWNLHLTIGKAPEIPGGRARRHDPDF